MTLSRLAPEAQVLLLAAGPPADWRKARMHALLGEAFPWQRLLSLADREHAEPILRMRLKEIDGLVMPEAAAEQLRRQAMVAEFHVTHLEHRLHEALDILDQAGIEPIVLKGAALAYMVYRSFADRPMGDIDLLCDPDRVKEARALLQPSGWDWSQDPAVEARYRNHHHLPPLGDQSGTGLRLELHTSLFPTGHPFPQFNEDFVANRIPIAARDRFISSPDLLFQLLHVCLHFAWSHVMQVGAWRAVRDVDTIVRHGTINWEAFADHARRYQAETCCYWTLRLARTITDAPIPDTVYQTLRPRYPGAVLSWLEQRYLRLMLPSEGFVRSVRFNRIVWQLGIDPSHNDPDQRMPWDAMGPESNQAASKTESMQGQTT
jgi:hypothetical protein